MMGMRVRLALGLWVLLISLFVFVSGHNFALVGVCVGGYMVGSGLFQKLDE